MGQKQNSNNAIEINSKSADFTNFDKDTTKQKGTEQKTKLKPTICLGLVGSTTEGGCCEMKRNNVCNNSDEMVKDFLMIYEISKRAPPVKRDPFASF